MKPRPLLGDSRASHIAWLVARFVTYTLRITVIGEEFLDRLRTDSGESVILVTWHGRILLPLTRLRDRGYWAMLSTSRDGNVFSELFQLAGFHVVRGSTSSRGAIESSLTICRELKKGGVLTHAPDGPRGPSGVVHPGAIYFAQKVGCPIVPAGIAAWPNVRLRTWDRYMLPLPFARAGFVYGDPIAIPSNLDSAGRDIYAAYVGERIKELEEFADKIAHKGYRACAGERPVPPPPPVIPPRSPRKKVETSDAG